MIRYTTKITSPIPMICISPFQESMKSKETKKKLLTAESLNQLLQITKFSQKFLSFFVTPFSIFQKVVKSMVFNGAYQTYSVQSAFI